MFISALRKKGLLLISTCGTFFFIEWAKKFLPAAGTAQLAIKHLIVVHQRKGGFYYFCNTHYIKN